MLPLRSAPAPPPPPTRPDPTASWENPLPGVRCGGPKKGRLLKPGRLAAGNVCHYVSKKHIPPETFIRVTGEKIELRILQPGLGDQKFGDLRRVLGPMLAREQNQCCINIGHKQS